MADVEKALLLEVKPSIMPPVADRAWLVDAKFNLRQHFGCR